MLNLENAIWILIPVCWQYNEEYYQPKGFLLPDGAYTLREVAEEALFDKTISDFRNVATNSHLGSYYNPNATSSRLSSFSEQELDSFYQRWPMIDREEFLIPPSELNKMTDDEIINLMSEIDLRFYYICPTKIYC